MALTQSEHSEPEGAEKKRERPPCVASHHTCPHVMWLLSSPRNAASAPAQKQVWCNMKPGLVTAPNYEEE